MNIFVSSSCPQECARFLDDRRVVKMVLESAQMLSTAMHLRGDGEQAPYRPNHQGHPCTVWVAEDLAHFAWLLDHFEALLEEYSARYPGKVHKCASLVSEFVTYLTREAIEPVGEPNYFPNCTRNVVKGIDYRDLGDVYLAYQLYLNDRWDTDTREPTWYGESYQ